jgi:hypothetical protein
MTTPAPAKSAAVHCPACLGSGRWSASSVYTGKTCAVGGCFTCRGTGRVSRATVGGTKAARLRANRARYTITSVVLLAAADQDTERAHFYLRLAVVDLFAVGEELARDVLGSLLAGVWYDDSEGTRGTISSEVGAELRAEALRMAAEIAPVVARSKSLSGIKPSTWAALVAA